MHKNITDEFSFNILYTNTHTRLTKTGIDGITLVVLGPLGAVLDVVQVPAGGVQHLVAQPDRSAHIGHLSHPHFDHRVIWQLEWNFIKLKVLDES